jgi:hypothetical protein
MNYLKERLEKTPYMIAIVREQCPKRKIFSDFMLIIMEGNWFFVFLRLEIENDKKGKNLTYTPKNG